MPELPEPSEFPSACGVSDEPLRSLLQAGCWQDADRETKQVLLQAAGRTAEGWRRREDIERLPCEDWRSLDRLWLGASDRRFGFSLNRDSSTFLISD